MGAGDYKLIGATFAQQAPGGAEVRMLGMYRGEAKSGPTDCR
jgi:hypothetical protein